MKKLLLLILLPLISFGQDFKIGMNYGADANVGEEIELKFEIFPAAGQEVTATFLQFDVNWNNKLIQYVSSTIDPMGKLANPQLNRTHWDGYKFNPDTSIGVQNLRGQYDHWRFGTNVYPDDSDWSVDRYTLQSTGDINLYDAVLTMKFKILDRAGSNYADYSDLFKISWARLDDNRTDPTTEYSIVSSYQSLSLDPGGVGAGDVTLNLDVPHSNKQDYGYSIYAFSQLEGLDFDEDGEIDQYVPKVDEVPLVSGQFDANGVSSVSTLTIDEMHWIHTHITFDGQSHPAWLDDVVTVTDVYKIFQYSLDSDINGGGGTWEYEIQNILGEVTNDGRVNFDDSYELLAHVNGVVTSANVTSKDNGPFSLSALKDVYGKLDGTPWHTFTPTENNKSFTISHGLRGDVDFSHSAVPTIEAASTAKQSVARQIVANRNIETANIDLSSRLEDGKVIVDVNLDTEGLVGSQFKVVFDSNILTLDDIEYDSGNTMTNFGTVKGNVVSFGSLDYEGNVSIKTGTPYRLIFTPNEAITNTAGLISYKIIEGVKADGTKVKFQY